MLFLTLGGEQDRDGVKGKSVCRAERQPGEGRWDRAQEMTGPLPPSLSGVFKAQSVYGMYPSFLWADPGWGGPDVGRQLLSNTERFWS